MEEQRNPVADEEAGAVAPETDVAPEPSPAADDDGDAAPDTDRVVCPDATVQLDGLLTAASGGGPTPLFRVAQLACWVFAAFRERSAWARLLLGICPRLKSVSYAA